MRYLIGERHRQIILDHIPAGGRFLEFGSGTSSAWLAERLPRDASMVSIEHDATWFARVQEMLSRFERCEQHLRPPTGIIGPNASPGEERPDLLHDYIHAADTSGPFDVILIDGVARDACLEHARTLLKPGGTVFLHDAQRPWYDRGKRSFVAHGHAGTCADYVGPHLWWGGAEHHPPARAEGQLPLIVSAFTRNTPYEQEADRLRASLERLDLEHEIVPLEDRGSWNSNCALKPGAIASVHNRAERPVLWVDADAVVHDRPELLRGTSADFAVHLHDGWILNSATVYFGQSFFAERLLREWMHLCETFPEQNDQVHLDSAWEAVSRIIPIQTRWLPYSYAKIFDVPCPRSEPPIIEQFQASRRLGGEHSTRPPTHTPSLRVPRLARRPREDLVHHTWHQPDVPTSVAQPGRVTPTRLPIEIKRGLADRLALELVMTGVQRVAVYGAGRFAKTVLLPVLAERGIRVLCIADDSPARSQIDGVPVMPPADAARRDGLEAVVASSDAHEHAIARKAHAVFTVPVLRVIDWPSNREALAASLV